MQWVSTMRAFLVAAFVLIAVCVTPHAADALPVQTIVIDTQKGPVKFQVEIAGSPESQERGLMFRSSMDPDAGMLFDFHDPQFVSFWMKNTYIPLDMLFVRANGTISSITENAKPMSLKPIPSFEPVTVVIEINGGRARELGIGDGDVVHATMFGDQHK
jgi:uncharacterized membrane protein (UPF0127 family)